MLQFIKLVKKGIMAGQAIRQELIPDHELAMYEGLKTTVKSIDVSVNDAIMYLKKENILLPSAEKGWLLLKYQTTI